MSSSQRLAVATALAAVVAAAGCDKVPLLAPTNSSIRLVASITVVPTNAAVQLTAVVIESSGTPVQNGTLVTFTSSLGSIEPANALTDNGQVTVTFNSGSQSGTATISAFSGGAQAEAVEILVGAAAAGAVSIRANPAIVPSTGGTTELVATVVDTGGNPLRGAPVTFSTTFGTLAQATSISDLNGEARTQLTTNTNATVTARVGGGTSAPTATVEVQARSVPAVTITAGTNNIGEVGIPMVFTLEPPAAATSNAIREAIVNFGDGTVRNIGSLLARTTIAYTYTRPGVYTVTVTATDVMNFTATSSVAVTINEAATVPIQFLATPGTGGIVNFSASVSGTISGGGSIRTYEWDFGDGGRATTTGPTTSHRYAAGGNYVVRLRVITTTGQEGFAEQTVRVTLL
jgi:PKD domain/Bacterial Ig-like domain (group 1)